MTWMQLVTFLASLFNTAALLYWQNANERRMDLISARVKAVEDAVFLDCSIVGRVDDGSER